MRGIWAHTVTGGAVRRRLVLARAGVAMVALVWLLAACGGGSAHRATVTDTASYQTLINAGRKLLSVGNADAARQLFQQAVAKNPGDPVGHYNLGVVDQGSGDATGARQQYGAALRIDPRYVPALYNDAVLLSQSNAPLATYYYRQVISVQPRSPTAWLNLGLLESHATGLRRRSRHDLGRAVALEPALRARIPKALREALCTPPDSRRHHSTTHC